MSDEILERPKYDEAQSKADLKVAIRMYEEAYNKFKQGGDVEGAATALRLAMAAQTRLTHMELGHDGVQAI